MLAQVLPVLSRYAALHDKELMELVRNGDPAAFDELYGRHRKAVAFVAFKETDNRNDAEDVVAEAFLEVFRALSVGTGPQEHFKPYVLTITRRMAHRRNQLARRAKALEHDRALEPIHPQAEQSTVKEESTMLMQALRSLPVRWQTVLKCIDLQDMRHAEVAARLGVSPNAVASLLIRAREGLRVAYLQQHVRAAESDKCGKARRLLVKLARETIGSSERNRAESHLAVCPRCRTVLSDLRDIQSLMRVRNHGRSASRIPPSPDLSAGATPPLYEQWQRKETPHGTF
ncbi:sigma-70 family RNA polymerase sigma factor [Paenarthrobacter sp. NPDC018779]|uniref:sigma-70 family RNA polymerase sigma factor n=1 Tax=Paenarthrobacter sp. NPDC018779 TaxID=3364375 RepID=UPI0037C622D8